MRAWQLFGVMLLPVFKHMYDSAPALKKQHIPLVKKRLGLSTLSAYVPFFIILEIIVMPCFKMFVRNHICLCPFKSSFPLLGAVLSCLAYIGSIYLSNY